MASQVLSPQPTSYEPNFGSPFPPPSDPLSPAANTFVFSFPSHNQPVGPRHPSASAPSHISKTYRQASSLFLTRRLPEALTTVSPLINPRPAKGGGDASGLDMQAAPVATASRTTRVKVWSLYLTIMNAVLEMEPTEGKDVFGKEWRALCAKVREGDVWDEVVNNGYHGVEGDVDPDVVVNLATLLLAHSRTQAANQKRLEAYLASSNEPNLELASRALSASPSRTPTRKMNGKFHRPSVANTPRDLAARVKIIELYTLHVLLRNDQWDYARDFIAESPVLDEERREAFFQALQSLRDTHDEAAAARERREQQAKEEQEAARAAELAEEKSRKEAEKAKAVQAQVREEQHSNSWERRSRHASQSPASFSSRSSRAESMSIGSRASIAISSLRVAFDRLGSSLSSNPIMMTKLLAFVAGLVIMLGQKTVRERARQILALAWAKLRATIAMGMKVSSV